MLANYSDLRELMDELFEINIAILKKKSKV